MERIWYNIKISLRYLARQKNISLLNLLGLSIGMSVAILIFYFVNFENSYDNFHKDGKLIYRIISVNKGTGGTDYRATTPLPLPEVVRSDIKDAEMTTNLSLFLSDDEPVQIADQTFFNLTGYTADSYFFKMFNFPLISGDPNTVFDNPGSVVITRKTAKRLFGDERPLGKELIIGDYSFTVVGILKDLPENSIFKFDLLLSNYILKKMHPDLANMWWGGGAMIFIKIYTNQNINSVKTGLASIPGKYFPDYLKGRESYDLQPLGKIHLDNRVSGDAIPPVSLNYLYILMAIAIAVLFIACANFVNLSTSQSEKRSRETGLRKLAGGGRFQITCLGLFGLATFFSEKRTKEIGVRKVNGATIAEMMIMLNTRFIKWVIIAFVIATPVAWYVMHKWLQTFAYKTELSWWIFCLAGTIALVIALLTVSWQSWTAATKNPVDALRYE